MDITEATVNSSLPKESWQVTIKVFPNPESDMRLPDFKNEVVEGIVLPEINFGLGYQYDDPSEIPGFKQEYSFTQIPLGEKFRPGPVFSGNISLNDGDMDHIGANKLINLLNNRFSGETDFGVVVEVSQSSSDGDLTAWAASLQPATEGNVIFSVEDGITYEHGNYARITEAVTGGREITNVNSYLHLTTTSETRDKAAGDINSAWLSAIGGETAYGPSLNFAAIVGSSAISSEEDNHDTMVEIEEMVPFPAGDIENFAHKVESFAAELKAQKKNYVEMIEKGYDLQRAGGPFFTDFMWRIEANSTRFTGNGFEPSRRLLIEIDDQYNVTPMWS